MYKVRDILQGLREPRSLLREVNRVCHTRAHRWPYNVRGVDIFEEDWDNLIILDACRYDTFEALTNLPGETDHRISRGSTTYEFIRANFTGRRLHDTVYVGANEWYLKLRDDIDAEVHDFINLQRPSDDIEFVMEDIDDVRGEDGVREFNVVSPASVTRAARNANADYPEKRLIVHYLQPHHPFIGPKGRKWFDHQSSSLLDVLENTPEVTPWKVQEAYRENLALVLPKVAELLITLPGKTVVTADHGEMLNDRHRFLPMRDYGHHEGIYNDPLVTVPWHVSTTGDRKDIVPGEPKRRAIDEGAVDDHLRNLGYAV